MQPSAFHSRSERMTERKRQRGRRERRGSASLMEATEGCFTWDEHLWLPVKDKYPTVAHLDTRRGLITRILITEIFKCFSSGSTVDVQNLSVGLLKGKWNECIKNALSNEPASDVNNRGPLFTPDENVVSMLPEKSGYLCPCLWSLAS